VVDRAAAEAMRDLFVEVVVAPRVDADALAVFREKKNLRVVELPKFADEPSLDYKRVRGGFLVQDRFRYAAVADESKWHIATTRRPTDAQWNDLRFAWAAVGSIKSNAIVLVRDEAAIGIGAGQMSRVDSSFLAAHKARQQGNDPRGAVLASDAFFPFRDGVDEAAAADTLGIPHPPGNPLFVLMAHVFGLLPLAQGYAQRINLFAAATSAISAGCWFLVAERWLRSFVPALWPRRLAALAGAIVSATAFTVWNQSVVNEKVYTLSLLSIALILWFIVRWDDQPPG